MRTQDVVLGAAVLAAGAAGIAAVAKGARRPSEGFQGRVVLITGGSRGLGLVMARQLAAQGARLALIARDEQELAEAAEQVLAEGGEVLTLAANVRDRHQVDWAVRRTIEHFGQLDVLVHCAGVILLSPFEHLSVEDFEESVDVHMWASLHATRAAQPELKRRRGRIVNISSIGGRVAAPHLLPYCVGKFALTGLSEGLHAELARYGVSVTTVCPGLMRTGSPPNTFQKGRHRAELAWLAIPDSLPLISISAEKAAHRIIESARRRDARLVFPIQARAAAIADELFPELSSGFWSLINRVMPDPLPGGDQRRWSARDSTSALVPSLLTRLTQIAARRNNEGPLEA